MMMLCSEDGVKLWCVTICIETVIIGYEENDDLTHSLITDNGVELKCSSKMWDDIKDTKPVKVAVKHKTK